MLDPHGKLNGCDLRDKIGTVQVCESLLAGFEPSQSVSQLRNLAFGSADLIVTLQPVIGEPPVGGACHVIITFDPLTVVTGAAGLSGYCAASIEISAE